MAIWFVGLVTLDKSRVTDAHLKKIHRMTQTYSERVGGRKAGIEVWEFEKSIGPKQVDFVLLVRVSDEKAWAKVSQHPHWEKMRRDFNNYGTFHEARFSLEGFHLLPMINLDD
jgi:hypothetical protein